MRSLHNRAVKRLLLISLKPGWPLCDHRSRQNWAFALILVSLVVLSLNLGFGQPHEPGWTFQYCSSPGTRLVQGKCIANRGRCGIFGVESHDGLQSYSSYCAHGTCLLMFMRFTSSRRRVVGWDVRMLKELMSGGFFDGEGPNPIPEFHLGRAASTYDRGLIHYSSRMIAQSTLITESSKPTRAGQWMHSVCHASHRRR